MWQYRDTVAKKKKRCFLPCHWGQNAYKKRDADEEGNFVELRVRVLQLLFLFLPSVSCCGVRDGNINILDISSQVKKQIV